MSKEEGLFNKSFVFSILLHLALFAFLIINLNNAVNYSTSEKSENPKIIQAAVVSGQEANKAPSIRPTTTPTTSAVQAFSHKEGRHSPTQEIPNSQKTPEYPVLEPTKAVAAPAETKPEALKPITPEKKPVPIKQTQATNNKLKQAMERDLEKQLAREIAEEQLSKAVENEGKTFPLKPARHPLPQAGEGNQLEPVREGKDSFAEAPASPPISAGEMDKYKALIIQAISQHWLIPDDISPGLSCELFIRLSPGGEVLSVEISRSSGDIALDRSARAAVFKASPLPIPKETEVFDKFRELRLTVHPENVM